jgi:antitoxin HigA-1
MTKSPTLSFAAGKSGMRPVHPGEILREDYLLPIAMTPNALARALKVPAPRINDIVLERRGVSADTALRLARYFGGNARTWMNLQSEFEMRVVETTVEKRILREITPRKSRPVKKTTPRRAARAR